MPIIASYTIPFPCHFRQNEIEFCQDENQDRVNEFQFSFGEKFFAKMKLNFAKKKMTFAELECEVVLKLSFATAKMNFVHASSLFLCLVKPAGGGV